MTTATIKFRAKLDTFSGGTGYKVPALNAAKHVTFSDRDTVATLLSTAHDLSAALSRYVEIPSVVWEDGGGDTRRDTSAWTIQPVGNGFMSDVSLTFELKRRAVA